MDSKFCNPFRTDFMVFYSFLSTHLALISSQIYCLILQPHRISTYLEQTKNLEFAEQKREFFERKREFVEQKMINF